MNSVWRECIQLKDALLFEIFATFCVPVVRKDSPQIVMLSFHQFIYKFM